MKIHEGKVEIDSTEYPKWGFKFLYDAQPFTTDLPPTLSNKRRGTVHLVHTTVVYTYKLPKYMLKDVEATKVVTESIVKTLLDVYHNIPNNVFVHCTIDKGQLVVVGVFLEQFVTPQHEDYKLLKKFILNKDHTGLIWCLRQGMKEYIQEVLGAAKFLK